MTIKFQDYLFTFHHIKRHIFLSKLYKQILHKLGYTNHCYSNVSEANHLHEQTLNIAEKALSVYNIFCGIQELLLLFNKI